MNDIKKKINKLCETINNHNLQYYAYDNPLISDYEYDILFKELEALEQDYPDLIPINSPTKRVGDITPLLRVYLLLICKCRYVCTFSVTPNIVICTIFS